MMPKGAETIHRVPGVLIERPNQEAFGGKSMTATVEPRFNTVFRHPQTPLRQVLALYQRRTVIAHLQDNLLLEQAILAGEEILKLRQVSKEMRIHTGRKHYG